MVELSTVLEALVMQRPVVMKESDMDPHRQAEYFLLTDDLVRKISMFSAHMSTTEVLEALVAGKTVYTNFSHYRLVGVEQIRKTATRRVS